MIRLFVLFHSLIFFFELNAQKVILQSADFNNKKTDEYGPAYYRDGLLFVSNRKNHVVNTVVQIDEKGNEVFLSDLFYAHHSKGDSNHFVISSFGFNKAELEDGPATATQDGNLIIFTRSQTTISKRKKAKIGLYETQLENGVWTDPKLLSFVLSTNNYSQPALSPEEDKLYFVSDLPKGEGGMDIWVSNKLNGTWSTPINAGNIINSPENEIFPFINKEGSFYFSSNRGGGPGGYDIFLLKPNSTKVTCLEEPINSPKNDYSLITFHGHHGYFSSDRKGTDDIYGFVRDVQLPDTCLDSYKSSMCYTFYDTEPLAEDVSYKYKWYFGDGQIGYDDEINHCFEKEGTYKISMSLLDTLTGAEITNVSEYELVVKKQLKNYIHLDVAQGKRSISVRAVKDENKKHNEGLIWLVDGQIIMDQDELDLSKIATETGYHSVKVIGINGDSSCYTNYFFTDLVTAQQKKMLLIPGLMFDDTYFSEDMINYFIREIDPSKKQRFVLEFPANVRDKHQQWIDGFAAEFKTTFEQELNLKEEKKGVVNVHFYILENEN